MTARFPVETLRRVAAEAGININTDESMQGHACRETQDTHPLCRAFVVSSRSVATCRPATVSFPFVMGNIASEEAAAEAAIAELAFRQREPSEEARSLQRVHNRIHARCGLALMEARTK